MPTLVQGALQARLDRLPPRTREVVSVASAIGRGFGLPLLERLLPREQVVPALSDLMRLDLIVEVSRRPAPEYRFRHGLVQEVAYDEPARAGAAQPAPAHRRGARDALRRDERGGLRAARAPLRRGRRARARRALPRCSPATPRAPSTPTTRRSSTTAARARSCGGWTIRTRERDTLFKIALVRHLAFDYARAGQAYDAAFDCSTEERTRARPGACPSSSSRSSGPIPTRPATPTRASRRS